MSEEEQIDLALKLTEIQYRNYTGRDYLGYSTNVVYDYFKDTFKQIKEDWRDNIE